MLAMKVLRFEEGSITIYNRSMILIPSEMIVSLYEIIKEKAGEKEAERIMFQIGEDQTSQSTKRYLDTKKELRPVFSKVTTGDPAIEMGREVLRMSGLGETRIVEVTKDFNKFVVATKNSPVAKEYLRTRGRSGSPVCFFLMGMMHGVLKGMGQLGYTARETRCHATGLANECVFEFVRKGGSEVNPPE
jgi:predicted hydrocarbon binding protein